MQTDEQNVEDAVQAQNKAADEAAPQAAGTEAPAAEQAAEAVPVQQEQAEAEQPAEEAEDPQVALTKMRGQLAALAKLAKDDHERMLRAAAEADNVRKRAEADVERERKFAMERFVKAILPVYDSLDQALTLSDRENPAAKATLEGVENTLKLLLKELSNFGVECINPQGEPFNPHQHQAISAAPSADLPPNHVLAVMQKGFILNGRVVRPAMVMVSKAAEKPAEPAPKSGDNSGSSINIEL